MIPASASRRATKSLTGVGLVLLGLTVVRGHGGASSAVSENSIAVSRVSERTSDQVVAADMATFARWQARLDSLANVRLPRAHYRRALAQAWLDLLRAEYARNDECEVVQAIGRQATDLIRGLERGDTTGSLPEPLIEGDRTGEHLWRLVASIKEDSSFACVEAEVARLESELVKTAHEAREGIPCESERELERAERLADDLRRKAKACGPEPVAEAPPPLTPAETRQIELLPRFVHFALDSASLGSTTQGVLTSIARTLVAVPQIQVLLEGHADRRASVPYNMDLSKRRVIAVRDYLVSAGVAAERMQIAYYGKSRPRVPGDDIQSFARNRCVIFTYVFPSAVAVEVVPQEWDLQLETLGPRGPRRRR